MNKGVNDAGATTSSTSSLDHSRAPFAEALAELAKASHTGEFVRASVPGHLADPDSGVARFFGRDLTHLDIAPMTDGLDADPAGGATALDEARQLAADAWGGQRTWFLTGGASQGNLAACLALRSASSALAPNSDSVSVDVVVQRSVHSSVMDGMALAGLHPIAVMPAVDADRGMAHGLTPELLDEALHNDPGAIGAYVVSPSYFGAVSDIAGLARVAHAHGVPLVVDEAWGAHLGFHPDLPLNALRLGADLVISSTHKLGGSLGQSAMVHLGRGPWAELLGDHVDRTLRMITSTSESGLLIASLDLARRDLMTNPEQIADSVQAVNEIRAALRQDPRFGIVTDDFVNSAEVFAIDPMRVVIDTRGTGLTGHEVRHRLFHHHGMQVEMSTDAVIVGLIGAGRRVDGDRLVKGLRDMPHGNAQLVALNRLPSPGERLMPLRQAIFAESELVSAAAAIGRISADSMAAYPPGVPNVLPGEVVTAENVAFLQAAAAAPHGYVRGAHDPAVGQVRVLATRP